MKFILIGTHAPEWVGRAQERGALAHAKCQALGIAVLGNYFTQGPYDFVTIVEASGPEAASAFSIWYMSQGFGRVQTMLAYEAAAFSAVLDRAR